MHLGQGEEEPEEQPEQDIKDPPPPQAIPLAREYARQQAEQSVRDESKFSITSADGYTTVQIKVAGPVTSKLLLAASTFMEELQPQPEKEAK